MSHKRIIAVISLLSTLTAASAHADSLVTAHTEVEVRHTAVKLSDVFEGVPTEIDREIAQAPAPCKNMVYDVNVLNRLAQKYRLDWTPQSMADHVTVSSACTRITADALKAAVIQKMKDDGVRGEIDIAFDNRAIEIDLPADQSPYFSLNNFSYDPASKRFRSEVLAANNNNTNIPISGRITVRQSIPVLAHRLEAGATIAANDIDWIVVPEEHVTAVVIQDADKLVGRELRHDTNGGEILRSGDVAPVRHVTRGSLVTLKIETPFMTLTAQGKAMQDGANGDVVRVTNAQSNRVVEGIVEGSGVVRVQSGMSITQKVALAQ